MFYNKEIFKRCFHYRGIRWYKNITQIPLYFRLIHYLVKHGYDEYATWEIDFWFIKTMKSILTQFRDNHTGYPVMSDDDELQAKSEVEFDKTLDKMIFLLDSMDEDSSKYDNMGYIKRENCIENSKNEFFELFSKYFYYLWD